MGTKAVHPFCPPDGLHRIDSSGSCPAAFHLDSLPRLGICDDLLFGGSGSFRVAAQRDHPIDPDGQQGGSDEPAALLLRLGPYLRGGAHHDASFRLRKGFMALHRAVLVDLPPLQLFQFSSGPVSSGASSPRADENGQPFQIKVLSACPCGNFLRWSDGTLNLPVDERICRIVAGLEKRDRRSAGGNPFRPLSWRSPHPLRSVGKNSIF